MKRIDVSRREFRKDHRPEFQNRYQRIGRYHNDEHYRYYYSGFYKHGFYGGYYYPVRPAYDIDVYFAYPTVSWMFNPSYDEAYYRAYYPDYDQHPVEEDANVGVFYPTDSVRDMAVEVSAYPSATQANFRTGITNLTKALSQQVSDNLQSPITLETNDVVINHYKNLGGNALVVEGFFDRDDLHLPFKALVDLRNPSNTTVFVPTAQDPTAEDLAILDNMNQTIVGLGGDPFTADQEPAAAN